MLPTSFCRHAICCLCFKHADVEDIPHITHALYLLTKDGCDLLQVAQQKMLSWKAPA